MGSNPAAPTNRPSPGHRPSPRSGAIALSDSLVIATHDGPIADIRIARPAKKNALTAAMYGSLADAIVAAEDDPAIHVLLLSGQGDAFTAGNDLADFLVNPPSGSDAPVFRFLAALSTARKPVVAAIHGAAIGIGTTVLLHCDLVVAAEDTRLGMPFTPLGLTPEAAASLLLPAQAGYHRAAEMLLLGEPFDAATALAAGLVNRVVAADAVLPTARALAHALAARPPEAIRLTKQLLRTPPEPVAERIAREAEIFAERLRSPELADAARAFLDRRR